VAAEFGIPEAESELADLARKSLAGDLFRRLRAARRVHRELPFTWRDGGTWIEGTIDLVLEEADGLAIVDYKSDRVSGPELAARAERYRPQLELYAAALAGLTGTPPKEALLYFVRSGATIPVRGSGTGRRRA
jgi:ATP-dependent helicase/nuclease subunit A